jgi:hypothetical protein
VLRGAALGEVHRALTPSIGGYFLFQSLLDRPLDGGEDGGVHLLTDLCFDLVREASAIDDLHRAIKVASGMELLGMAHRDILLETRWLLTSSSPGCPKHGQFREIIRTLPSGDAVTGSGNRSIAEIPVKRRDFIQINRRDFMRLVGGAAVAWPRSVRVCRLAGPLW